MWEEKISKQFSFGMAINNIIHSRGEGGAINDSIRNIDNNETRIIAIIIVVALHIEKENGWWLKFNGIIRMKEPTSVKQLSPFTLHKNYF